MKRKFLQHSPQIVPDHTVIPLLRLQADVETKLGLSFDGLTLCAGVWHARFRDGRCVPVRRLLHRVHNEGRRRFAPAI